MARLLRLCERLPALTERIVHSGPSHDDRARARPAGTSSADVRSAAVVPSTSRAAAVRPTLPGADGVEHPSAGAYRRTADAFRSGNLTLLSSLIDADVVWHVPGRHAMAGDIHGRDALLAWFAQLRPKGFWLSEHDVLGNDEHVCALSVMGARRDGLDVQTRVVSVFHYRAGQQLERWFYPEDPVAWDVIFAD